MAALRVQICGRPDAIGRVPVRMPNGRIGLVPEAALQEVARATGPTLLTMLGYIASLVWLAGGPAWAGIAGLVLDELDGRLARASGQVTTYGGELDYAVDLTLTGLSVVKAFGPKGLALLPLITGVQAAHRAKGIRPEVGSWRAVATAIAVVKGR